MSLPVHPTAPPVQNLFVKSDRIEEYRGAPSPNELARIQALVQQQLRTPYNAGQCEGGVVLLKEGLQYAFLGRQSG